MFSANPEFKASEKIMVEPTAMVPPSSTKKGHVGVRRGVKEEAKDHLLTTKAVKKGGAV